MSGGHSTYTPNNAFMRWLDSRLPLPRLVYDSFVAYPVPKNLNYMYTFGGILSVILILQLITGIVLAMHYVASVDLAFGSVESIMRDVNYGWLLRRLHANGASFFFLAVYIHMFRGMYYGSYKAPREVLWILGVIIFIVMIATAFMGYVLPWGQMSYWAATVITGLFSAIPLVGHGIQEWLLGGFSVGQPTLNRFFSLHYLLPFVIVGLVALHVWALHVTGQTNPTGVEVKDLKKDTLPFTPYATIKDGFAMVLFFLLMAWFVFYMPDFLGHPDNYIEGNPLKTPAHIVPEWYFLPFYAILRAIDFNITVPFTDIILINSKLGGVVLMFASLVVLLLLPWLDSGNVRSGNYRPRFRQFFWIFVLVCIGLGYLGSRPAEGGYIIAAQILTFWYFFHLLIILPILSLFERTEPLPASIADSILSSKSAKPE